VPKPNEWIFTAPDGSVQAVQVRGSFQANTGIALRSAALAGVGIATTASFIVHDDLRRGALLPVLPDHAMRARDLYAIYPHNRHLSPKVRAFIDFATDIYRTPVWAQ
jgi:DNA-binding transcriptional LysR family regulator